MPQNGTEALYYLKGPCWNFTTFVCVQAIRCGSVWLIGTCVFVYKKSLNDTFTICHLDPPGQLSRAPKFSANRFNQSVLSTRADQGRPVCVRTESGHCSRRQAMRDHGLLKEFRSWIRTIRWASRFKQTSFSSEGISRASLWKHDKWENGEYWTGKGLKCHPCISWMTTL